jgi:type II secretory pathway predicted ATPase ExeA
MALKIKDLSLRARRLLAVVYRHCEPEKRYKILSLAHSSLTGSDLIRSLCRQLGVQPQMRRSDNVANIHAALGQLGSRWPLLVLEEAQNFSASALEEVRLLTCARSDTRPPFSLLLIGEDSLLPRLQMGINHALISRLGFAQRLCPSPHSARACTVP